LTLVGSIKKMRPIETKITNRKLKFVEFDISKNWILGFPNDNWCLIIIAEENKPTYFVNIPSPSTFAVMVEGSIVILLPAVA